MLHVGYFDAAGAGTHMSLAVNEHTQHQSFTAFLNEGVISQGPGIRPQDFGEPMIQEAIAQADVLFLHVSVNKAHGRSMPEWDLWDEPALKGHINPDKCVMWLNGSIALRENRDGYKKYLSPFRCVATNADVAEMYDAAWMPCAIAPILDGGTMRWSLPAGDMRFLAHCPTDVVLKNVPEVMAALGARSDWKYKLIVSRPHLDSLVERMQAHALFDHFRGYFGVCAIEGAALGMPVIVNLGPESRHCLERFGGLPPWWQAADCNDLLAILNRKPADEEFMQAGAAGRRWYEQGFTNRHKANRLVGWLEAA